MAQHPAVSRTSPKETKRVHHHHPPAMKYKNRKSYQKVLRRYINPSLGITCIIIVA